MHSFHSCILKNNYRTEYKSLSVNSPFDLCGHSVEEMAVLAAQFCEQLSSVRALHSDLADELMEDEVIDVLLLADQC